MSGAIVRFKVAADVNFKISWKTEGLEIRSQFKVGFSLYILEVQVVSSLRDLGG